MKKILTVILCAILAINCAAFSLEDNTYNYVVNDTEITIEFATDSALSAEKKTADC